ncbi:MAG: dimethylarginine dimethylaminohydrolase family protein [Sphingobacterium sp.]
MLKLNVRSETGLLSAVILGMAESNGPVPRPEEAYDPKSLEHILAGTYPKENDMLDELTHFREVLERHGVEIYRPKKIDNLNQIFTRDIGFVIDDFFIKSNILPDRAQEWEAIRHIVQQIDPARFLVPPEHVHIEGGDVILWKDYVFIGTYLGSDYSDVRTARTNREGVQFIQEHFPHKKIKAFDLIKSSSDPRANALHLDCCFQPVGTDLAIIYPGGFRNQQDYLFLQKLFGASNLFKIDAEGMYQMYSNVFSISPEVVVSERSFKSLNQWLKQRGITVEEIPYHEIGKQEGLLRCSTLPLIRK